MYQAYGSILELQWICTEMAVRYPNHMPCRRA
jgi:hypothetical protein